MQGSQNNSGNSGQGGQGGQGGGGNNNNRRRRYRGNKPSNGPQGANSQPREGQGQQNRPHPNQGQGQQNRPNPNQGGSEGGGNRSRSRRPNGRVLTSNQVLVKYDNLLEQHLITRRKYYEYFNRVDERQLYRLEKNFFDSIEHLRNFEARLEPWQREALEQRKTERYKIDSTYSDNRGWNPLEKPEVEVKPDEIEDPHFKDTQKEAYEEYAEDTEESEGTFEDYLKLKGLN